MYKCAVKFCCKSCSATYNNKQRSPRTADSRKKTSNTIKLRGYKHPAGIKLNKGYSKVSFCKVCCCVIRHKIVKTCSKSCLSLLMSERMKTKNRTGKNYTKRCFYVSPSAGKVYLESSWEIQLAESLDDNNIKWIRPQYINYTLNDKRRSYYPDFYLIDYDVYLDPKNNYQRKKDSPKISAVLKEHDIQLKLLNKEECNWEVLYPLLVGKVGFEPTRRSESF